MAYATQADLNSAFDPAEILQLADRNGDGVADTGVLDKALTDATNTMDLRLAQRYSSVMPFAVVPAELARWCCEIARYLLYTTNPPEAVLERYRQALRDLDAVAAGTLSLGVPDPASGNDELGPVYSAASRVFSRDTLADY